MRPQLRLDLRALSSLLPAVLTVALGLGLWYALVFLDRQAAGIVLSLGEPCLTPLSVLAPVLVEEAAKFLLMLMVTRRFSSALLGDSRTDRAGTGIVAIVIFSALENLSFLRAFPGTDIFQRLVWSGPVHLISALAYACAFARPRAGRMRDSPRRGILPGPAKALLFAVAWHLAANLGAGAGPAIPLVVLVGIANAIAIIALSIRLFDAMHGGSFHGKTS
jgi:hypothetical protein